MTFFFVFSREWFIWGVDYVVLLERARLLQYIGTIMVITPPNRARPEKKGEAQLDDPRKEVDYKSYYQGKGNDFLIHILMTAT